MDNRHVPTESEVQSLLPESDNDLVPPDWTLPYFYRAGGYLIYLLEDGIAPSLAIGPMLTTVFTFGARAALAGWDTELRPGCPVHGSHCPDPDE